MLTEERCVKIKPGALPLGQSEIQELAPEVPEWSLKDKSIEKEFRFGGFRESIDFVNRLADVAEDEDHHPDICVSYNVVRLSLSTHRLGGLTRNDFILAAKIDEMMKKRPV